MIIEINNWNQTFENADSRKRERLKCFLSPSGTDSLGYRRLTRNKLEGAAALGVFQALCQAMATLRKDVRKRGLFLNSDGSGMELADLSEITRFPEEVVENAIHLLSNVGWIDVHQVSRVEELEEPEKTWKPSGEGTFTMSENESAGYLPLFCQSSSGFVKGEGEGEGEEVVVVNGTELLRDEEEANAEIIVEQQQRQQHHLPSACYGVPVQTENRYRDAKPIYVSPTSDRPNGQTTWEKKAGEGDAIGALCAILSMSEDQIEAVTVELGGNREIMEAYAKSRATNNFQNRQDKTISPLNFRFDLGGFISAWRNREKENSKPKKKGPRVPKDWRERALALGVEEAKNERFYPLYELLERDVRMSIEADWKAEQEAKGITA